MYKAGFCILLPCLVHLAQSTNFIHCGSSDIGLRLAHPRSCSLFLICAVDQKIYIKKCPRGLHFNALEQVCDFPQKVKCYKELTSKADLCELCDCSECCFGNRKNPFKFSNAQSTTTRSPTTFPSTRTTISSTTLTESLSTQIETTVPTAINFEKSVIPKTCGCTAKSNIITIAPPTDEENLPPPSITTKKPSQNCDENCCGQLNAATLPFVGNCQKFIICQNQRQTVLSCPNNLHYNVASGNCDFPQNAHCPWPYMPPSGPVAGPSGTHCAYGGRCVGQNDGTTFANEGNACSSDYVVCQCECEVSRSCSAPLMFNSNNNVCDWANNFGC